MASEKICGEGGMAVPTGMGGSAARRPPGMSVFGTVHWIPTKRGEPLRLAEMLHAASMPPLSVSRKSARPLRRSPKSAAFSVAGLHSITNAPAGAPEAPCGFQLESNDHGMKVAPPGSDSPPPKTAEACKGRGAAPPAPPADAVKARRMAARAVRARFMRKGNFEPAGAPGAERRDFDEEVGAVGTQGKGGGWLAKGMPEGGVPCLAVFGEVFQPQRERLLRLNARVEEHDGAQGAVGRDTRHDEPDARPFDDHGKSAAGAAVGLGAETHEIARRAGANLERGILGRHGAQGEPRPRNDGDAGERIGVHAVEGEVGRNVETRRDGAEDGVAVAFEEIALGGNGR